MKYHAHIKLYGLPPTTNSTNAKGWRSRFAHARKWKGSIREWLYLNHAVPMRPLSRIKLTCIRHSSNSPDFDGLVGSFKSSIDSLVECGVLINDKMTVIGQPEYKWELAKRNEGYIEIIVEEI